MPPTVKHTFHSEYLLLMPSTVKHSFASSATELEKGDKGINGASHFNQERKSHFSGYHETTPLHEENGER
jgi:hypothetical protein